jgi:hypothetical protein
MKKKKISENSPENTRINTKEPVDYEDTLIDFENKEMKYYTFLIGNHIQDRKKWRETELKLPAHNPLEDIVTYNFYHFLSGKKALTKIHKSKSFCFCDGYPDHSYITIMGVIEWQLKNKRGKTIHQYQKIKTYSLPLVRFWIKKYWDKKVKEYFEFP